ncbi:MAG: polysaccharide deacetylase family protein [Bacillota bacterium]|uniref:Polysaccharide deacetylase family protein n=1 Tax=Virgibacillus salarius TaxID=447199 RepID=A0A941IDV7_9BACI|nr:MULTISPECIES: polysaccharide deacetylase family protein [Virgibacillus]NAZ10216.1 polysaccharide deacetylase family protein [Agaribacter marinus]MBR7797505.1 polysaccharide deacetylase family protein [Virgibacillus salarius]MCC2252424.1 polysaccharide deacetylase family protein [Virgibacillus sp. AGTR]MDY7046035.1 polysaccharide deacetylase family protein [Virgibacillus sp. M23]QRZ16576.1 polysaccharide deacetylase family protein [Virgibacillus sp. AGTR]
MKLLRYSLLFYITLLTIIIFCRVSIADVSNYPLQINYPNIMMYQGKTHQKVIALTFDDGPDQQYTPKILDILKREGVPATFFLMGARVSKYPNVARRIVEDGHSVGNHSFWHPQLTKTSVNRMKWEIKSTEKQILLATGVSSTLFRAPYGDISEKFVQELGNMGYKGIGWSIDTEDWKELSNTDISQTVLNLAHPGAIVLMHSAGHSSQDLTGTVESLKNMITILKRRGYRFVTIPELWNLNN